MRVDQTGEKSLNGPEPLVTLPIDQVAGGSMTASVEPPTERTQPQLNFAERQRILKSSVLDRVRQFLPQLAESNASLSSRDHGELDIENISGGDACYIEMVQIPLAIPPLAHLLQNIGLGVFEYARRGARSDDVSSISASSSSMSDRDSGGGDSSSSGSSSCSEGDAQADARPKKPLPKRTKQNITIPSETVDLPGGSLA